MTNPASWESDAVLADGGTVTLRPITPEDADALRAMHSRLSADTVYMRFFSMVRVLSDKEVARLTQVDQDRRIALVALLRGELVGVVRCDRLDDVTAEVAVVVEDAHQGRGLGPLLLEHLAAAAGDRGVQRFVANVLPSNRRMLQVFRSAGFEVERHMADGYVELSYPIEPTTASVSVAREREHLADARSVARLLAPRSVAVLGASRQPGSAGHEVLRALLEQGFTGRVHAINPAAEEVLGVRCVAAIGDVEDEHLDLVVIAVPAERVPQAVAECADKGVHALVVVAGGFADGGADGQARLAEVVRIARGAGMRLVGPNAMGVVNTDPEVRLHATFAAGRALPGRVGVFTQSGALAGAVLSALDRRRLGLSSFVSIGDRADVSGNDVVQFWRDDPRTEVVALHLQGFGNPRKFARIARDVGRRKPVVALKSGRGTGDLAVDAMFASAGVIRVDTLAQLFDTCQLLATQPVPAGPRVGIVGTSSALAALAVDACRANGLQVVTEVDLGPTADPEDLRVALLEVARSGDVDALLALITPHPDGEALAAAVLEASQTGGVPVLASYLGEDGVPAALAVADGAEAAARGSVPSYSSPESAALALSRAVVYAAWRDRPEGSVPDLHVQDVSLEGLPQDGTWVDTTALAAYGIEPWPTERVVHACAARAAGGAAGVAGRAEAPGRRLAQPRRPGGGAPLGGRGRARRGVGAGAAAVRRHRPAGAADGTAGAVGGRAPGAGPGRRAAAVAAARGTGGRPARRPGGPHPAAHRPGRRGDGPRDARCRPPGGPGRRGARGSPPPAGAAGGGPARGGRGAAGPGARRDVGRHGPARRCPPAPPGSGSRTAAAAGRGRVGRAAPRYRHRHRDRHVGFLGCA